MKRVYSNSENPRRAGVMAAICFVAAVGFYLSGVAVEVEWAGVLGGVLYVVLLGLAWWFIWRSHKCEIDEEAGTLTAQDNRKHPMKIADIECVNYCQTRKGRLKYLCIHENGVRFVNISLCRKVSDELSAHLQRLNPSITIKRTNYY